jgi:CHAT domain-containing protein
MADGHADSGSARASGETSATAANRRVPVRHLKERFSDRIIINHGRERRLELTLAQGDITQVDASCYVVGLFKAVAPDGAVSALDRAMNGGISDLIARRMFSAEAGEVSILPNGRRALRASNVAFVGLGSFDSFNAATLKLACDNLVRTFVAAGLDDFAMLPFGWTSVTASSEPGAKTDLVRAMLAGFLRAIEDSDDDHRFRALTICERDPDRFSLINDTVHDLAMREGFKDLELTIRVVRLPEPPPVPTAAVGPPQLQRVYLMAREIPQQGDTNDQRAPLQMSVLTAGDKAAIMVEQQPGSPTDLEALLGQLEGYGALSPDKAEQFGSTLTKLLLSDDISGALKAYQGCHLVVVHDAAASRIPWETLLVDNNYPALGGGVSHRYETANLSVAKWLQCRQQSNVLNVLLVINPTNNLPGADLEGERVQQLLKDNPATKVTPLHGDAATKEALLEAFSSGGFDMVHYAGHGFFDPQQRGRSGLFCANGEVLSGLDLATIDNLPTLMFFNACETARVRGADAAVGPPKDKSEAVQSGVGFAEALLRGGIANFIGTYWPVQDISAKTFAPAFYQSLLDGLSLNDALLNGRHALQKLGDSPAPQDWADYVFYGDPDFRLKACMSVAASSGGQNDQ